MGTTVFAAVRYVATGLASALAEDLPDIQVIFGGPKKDLPPNALHVGYEPNQGLGADVRQSLGDWTGARKETYDITLTAYTLDGDADALAAFDKAEAVYEAVKAWVYGRGTLGDLVARATVGSRLIIKQGQIPAGAATETQMTIVCDAWTDD